MPKFSKRSSEKLKSCHKDLQDILNIAIQYVDFTITEGHRNKETQDKYFENGLTKLKWPKGKHNKIPSLAVDIVPFDGGKIDYENLERFHNIVYFIKGIAYGMGIEVTLGCDWNNNFSTKDHKFHDAPHIELTSKLINGKWEKYQ